MRPRRLLGRIYLFGLLLLLGAGASQFVLGQVMFARAARPDFGPLLLWIVEKTLPISATPEALQRELAAVHQKLGIQVTIYDDAGLLLASSQPAAGPPLRAEELAQLRTQRTIPLRPRMGFAVGRFVGKALHSYCLILPRRPEPPIHRPLLATLLLLIVLGVISVPFARSLTKPLEQLAAHVRTLGQGNLRVRAATDRKDEVGDLARAFNEMAERVEQLVRTEKELIANVSHELRTPLARIRVVLDLAKNGERATEYLPEIAEDLAEIERMVDDILTTARLDLSDGRTGRSPTPLRLEATDPRQVLARSVSRFCDHHPERPLLVDVPQELPLLQADPVLLRRAIDNLLENAHKYSNPERVIELHAGVARREGLPARLEIVIHDEGIGIDPADLPHVFTPFFRTDPSRARKTGGVGLGLPLARRIARAHGGTLSLSSELGVGTTAKVELPLLP